MAQYTGYFEIVTETQKSTPHRTSVTDRRCGFNRTPEHNQHTMREQFLFNSVAPNLFFTCVPFGKMFVINIVVVISMLYVVTVNK
jgi:hypothetical protein